jgi:hypothetical protein
VPPHACHASEEAPHRVSDAARRDLHDYIGRLVSDEYGTGISGDRLHGAA